MNQQTVTPTLNTDTPIAQTPSTPAGVVIASFDDYIAAQSAVDLLSDKKFDVSAVRIVGHDLNLVEQVSGRMTKGRAALYGAGSGAWFGLLLGILLGIFLPNPVWLSVLLIGLALGAIWGAVFGFFGHLATGGRRDFTSLRSLQAKRYDLVVSSGLVEEAQKLLAAGR